MGMRSYRNSTSGSKDFVYFLRQGDDQQQQPNVDNRKRQQGISNDMLDKLLKAVGREALKERTPNLDEIEQTLQNIISQHSTINKEYESEDQKPDYNEAGGIWISGMPIVAQLIQKGYLKDSQKWLSTKGFIEIGGKILNDVMKALKTGDLGLHGTTTLGPGSLILDTTKKYEVGNDLSVLNIPRSLLNAVQRVVKKNKQQIKLPLKFDVEEDFEEYETMRDIRVGIVYCIDLSSTMRYSSMFGDMTRIEAAKRALWSLFLLNSKFFPSDSIYIIGFGALAAKIAPLDIPYLKTFEPGSDFLHYTNYQAAFRLARKILQKNDATNKRIVLITDGHPSACFIDNKEEQNKILALRPYSHFYMPDRETVDLVKQNHDMNLDITSGDLVFLCYRYRQIDQYIADRTIVEAKKCHTMGIEIDTIMISEEDSLLGYVNELEKHVKGRSYYINPGVIDKVLITDYLANKKLTIRASV